MKTIFTKACFLLLFFIVATSCSDDDNITNNPIVKITGNAVNFGNVEITETSQVRSYIIAAEGITSPVMAQVKPPFYLSLSSDGDFSNSVSLSPNDFGKEALPIFVRFQPEASDQGMFTDTIRHSSADLENIVSVAVSGMATVPGESMLAATKTDLDFGNVFLGNSSDIQSYTLSGSELEKNVSLEASGPFRISKTEDGEFSKKLTITAAEVLDDQKIFVLYEPTEEGNSTGKITHTSPDIDEPLAVSLSGMGKPVPAVSLLIDPENLDFPSTPVGAVSKTMSYTLKGNGLTSEVTIKGTSEFKISSTENGEFSDKLVIPAADFSSDGITVFVRFEPEGETGEKTGTLVHTTPDLEEAKNVELSGSAISSNTKLFSEDFDYTAGEGIPSMDRTGDGDSNAGLNGWLKVRGNNTIIPISNESLNYTGYSGSGVGNSVILNMEDPANNSNIYANNLSKQQDNDFVGAYYTSFMLKVGALPDGNNGGFNRTVMLVDWLPNGATKFLSSVSVEYNNGDPKFGIKYEGATSLTAITPEIGKTYLVVLKHIVTDADQGNSNNAAAVYIFENGNLPKTEPKNSNAIVPIGNTGDNYLVKAVSVVRDNSRGGSYLVDGIKVTTQWADLFE